MCAVLVAGCGSQGGARSESNEGGGASDDASRDANVADSESEAEPFDGATPLTDASLDVGLADVIGDAGEEVDSTAPEAAPAELEAGPDASSDATSAEASLDSSNAGATDAQGDGGCPPVTRTGSLAVTYQIDPAHTGGQPDDQLTLPLCQRWLHDFGESPEYALVADGSVFIATSPGPSGPAHVTALDELTGAVLWGPVDISGTYGYAGAAYDDGQIFVINFDGVLRALDAATGQSNWEAQLPDQYAFTSPPSCFGGVVFVSGAGEGGTLYAVNEVTGDVLWTQGVENGDHSSPAVSSAGVFVSYAGNQAYGFATADGTPLWHYEGPAEGGGGKTTALYGGEVYTRDFSGDLELGADDGTVAGTYQSDYIPAFSGGTMFTTSSGVLTAASLGDAGVAWASGGSVVLAPITVGSNVVMGTSTGIDVLSVADGTVVSSSALAGIPTPDEQDVRQLVGLSEADGMLFVPAGTTLAAY